MTDELTASADKLIEKWTARQEAKSGPGETPEDGGRSQGGPDGAEVRAPGGPEAPRPEGAPASGPDGGTLAGRAGIEVIKLETFVWKSIMWQVVGFVNAIPDGHEEAVQCVVVRALAPVQRGATRAERRRARLRGEKEKL